MSSTAKRWEICESCPPHVSAALSHYHRLLIQALYNRGIYDPAEVEVFLDRPRQLRDPFGLLGMREAVARIRAAIKGGEPIVVYGDFDADGVTSTALLVQALRCLGVRAEPYIPHRVDEGYGLHCESLNRVAETGAKLVVTVDCGIRSGYEVEYGRNKLGLDMIVTDHHSIQRDADGNDIVPPALAVINPKQQADTYPFKDLAGVGIAFKLAQALYKANEIDPLVPHPPFSSGDLLDLVALGTVADMAPLIGENRLLVRQGLRHLNGTVGWADEGADRVRHLGPRRPGLRALYGEAGLYPGKVNAQSIGFVIGPRLNAAGRLSNAVIAYQLLTAPTEDDARERAFALADLNRERQDLTRSMVEQAKAQLGEVDGRYLCFISDPAFNPGVVGLVAGRLTEEFYRPAIVAEIGKAETRGSCRSIPEFNITSALDECRDLLVRHGGHAAAAGFTVKNENLDELRSRMERIATEKLDGLELAPMLRIDAEIDLSDLDYAVCTLLSQLEPHGEANPQPVFATRGVSVVRDSVRQVGRDGQHLKFRVQGRGSTSEWDAIAFRMGEWADGMPGRVDIAYSVEMNEVSGRPQLTIKDLQRP